MLAASVLVAICSVTATAWLVAQSTSTAIRQELGNAVASDSRTYQSLLTWAVEHRTWDGVPVTGLAEARIVLTTEDRRLIADSGGRANTAELPQTPSAVITPLAVDAKLGPEVPADRVDPRVVGPFALTTEQQAALNEDAQLYLSRCVGPRAAGPLPHAANGRPIVEIDRTVSAELTPACIEAATRLTTTTAGESAAFAQLEDLFNACRTQRGRPPAELGLTGSWEPSSDDTDCLGEARRTQLKPFVAPTALLFVTDPAGRTTQSTVFSIDVSRTVLVAAVVLLLTVGVSVLVGLRLIRPLGTLTAAAERMRSGENEPVEIRSRGEIGQLARAFNDMAEHRARTEAQRKAMTSDVSHELRNPLGTIRSWLEGARDGVVELDRAQLDALLNEALVLQHLVDDLQDLAMVDAGELRLHPEPVELRDVFEQLVAAHPAVTASGGGRVRADPVRLRQILANLVTNALRYTPPGGTVRLSAQRIGDRVRIEVADTGIGIAADDLPHVFDRFWRADRSRTRETGGSGLGLAIVHGLVRAHDGTISVASTVGHGTKFTIELPAS
ncbi:HAMP domain-containing histidine kinase [Lentzea tibetensis]|uniref:histidine kinase n=2 Tax=Lentzea tibetensis TaxID=2591470 RepID=A0A563EL43_9PSEU|nr:HAMP domain-containing histidine kinase [Lentzea tibetensis]